MVYTSGTTGPPKGVVTTHIALNAQVCMKDSGIWHLFFPLDKLSRDSVLTCHIRCGNKWQNLILSHFLLFISLSHYLNWIEWSVCAHVWPQPCVGLQASAVATDWLLGPEDHLLHHLPLHHTHGILNGLLAPLWAGSSVHMLPNFEPEQVSDWAWLAGFLWGFLCRLAKSGQFSQEKWICDAVM